MITTTRPDGTPVAASVTVRDGTDGKILASGETGPWGFGTVEVDAEALEATDGVLLTAVAADGATGRCRDFVSVAETTVALTPEDVLPGRGQPVQLRLRTAEPGRAVLLRLSTPAGFHLDRLVVPSAAAESVTIPWRPEFDGPVTVEATPLARPGRDPEVWIPHYTVYYPERPPIGLKLRTSPPNAAPGGTIRLEAAVQEAGGGGEPAVLALAGVDEAVEAAARSTWSDHPESLFRETVTLERVGAPAERFLVVTGARGTAHLMVPEGSYDAEGSLAGFVLTHPPRSVRVLAGRLTRLELTMALETSAEVYVMAGEPAVVTPRPLDHGTARPLFTPRLRRDFRSSCLWLPEHPTGPDGRAVLTFTLPDPLTTWRLQGVALTADGRFASAETELTASLPLEAGLHLPDRLTLGDTVQLLGSVQNHGPEAVAAQLEAALDRLVERPGACAEQQASRALLATQLLGREDTGERSERLRGIVQAALLALWRSRADGGGMAYFPGGPPDPVLTAYVVRCLDRIRAAGFDVGSLPADLLAWLGSQQRMGMWKRVKTHGVETVERDTLEIARNLAAVGSAGDDVLMPALDALEPRVRGVMDDPWVLASWALATGPGTERGRWTVERLSGLARNEDDGVFWSPRRNLPMGGWGRASRIETTALAVRALHEAGGREDLVAAGVRFLQRHRNPEGIWWTGPTSVSVLETLANSCAAPVPNPGPPSEVMGCSASTPLRRSPDHAHNTRHRACRRAAYAAGRNKAKRHRKQPERRVQPPWPQTTPADTDSRPHRPPPGRRSWGRG